MNNKFEKDRTYKDLEYRIDEKGEAFVIMVRNIDTQEIATETYICQYKPIFGYDNYDIQQVENITEKIMAKMSKIIQPK